MIITNPDTGATHAEPLCRAGCGGFEAIPNPSCFNPEVHGTESGEAVFARICATVGHIPGSRFCLRCKAPSALSVDAADALERAEETRHLTRHPNSCQHTEAYWSAEDDCFSCGASYAPAPAPVKSP